MPRVPGQVTAVILAGGLGRRMSADGRGIDKAMVPFRGKPLVQHVIDRIRLQVGTILINADPQSGPLTALGFPLCPDQIEGRPGPLAGVHAGLLMMQTTWLLSVPCDTPLLPLNLVEQLVDTQTRTGADRVSARSADQSHPVIALIHGSLAPELETYLAGGGRRIEGWLSQGRWAQTEFKDEDAFVNLNTAEELQRLERMP